MNWEPGKRVEYGPSVIPGPARITVVIDDEEFPALTEEQYTRSVEAWAESLRGIR